jgi:hypothetical protein
MQLQYISLSLLFNVIDKPQMLHQNVHPGKSLFCQSAFWRYSSEQKDASLDYSIPLVLCNSHPLAELDVVPN